MHTCSTRRQASRSGSSQARTSGPQPWTPGAARSSRVAQPVTASRGEDSPGTVGTGRGSAWSARAGFDSPRTTGDGAGDGAALGSALTSIGADGTGDASAGAAGSGAVSLGAEGTRASSAAGDDTRASSAEADGTADDGSDTAALAVVHAVASSMTASAPPAAATPREAVLQTVRGRRGGLERPDRVDGFLLRVTRRSMSTGAGSMTAPGHDVVHTSRVSWCGWCRTPGAPRRVRPAARPGTTPRSPPSGSRQPIGGPTPVGGEPARLDDHHWTTRPPPCSRSSGIAALETL
jgi:hypothetical protein